MAIDHTVVEAVHNLVPQRHLADDAVVIAHTVLEGAEVDGLLDGRKVLAGSVELVVEHLQHARHGADAAADVLHIALQGAHRFGIVDADAQILEVVVHRTLEDVVQRQERQHAIVGRHRVHLGVGQEVAADVAVAQHHALRVAGGAAGVDQRQPVVGLGLLLALLQLGQVLLAAGDAELQNLQRAVIALYGGQGVDVGLHLKLLHGAQYAAQQHLAAHQYQLRLAVAEDVDVVLRGKGGIDRHVDGTHQRQRHIHKVPLRAVVRDRNHAVAGLDAQLHKAIGHKMSVLIIVVGAVAHPFAVDLAGQDIVLRMVHHKVVQQVEQSCNFNFH